MMGVWGYGNFDSDVAGEYLDSVIRQFVATIERHLSRPKEEFSLDFHFDAEFMPSVDIMICLCEHYDWTPFVSDDVVRQWAKVSLEIFDRLMDKNGLAKSEYERQRREVIIATFAKLEALAHKL